MKRTNEKVKKRTVHVKTRRVKPSFVISETKNPGLGRKPLQSDNNELSGRYDTTRLVLIAKDPFWMYAYWEVTPNSLESLKSVLTEEQKQRAKTILRVYDVTLIDFNGMNANSYFDVEVGNNSDNWYINLWHNDVSYMAEIGLKIDDGRFYSLTRSNCVHVPRSTHSKRVEEIWMRVEDNEVVSPVYVTARPNGPARAGRKRKVFYVTEEEIRRYYANLGISIKDIISTRLGGSKAVRYRFLLEGENEEAKRRILSRFPKEYFLKKLQSGASFEFVELGLNYSGGQE
ncbi:MAG: DUF4912 domain-containing protein [Candidatus Omnitrophota bacterium]